MLLGKRTALLRVCIFLLIFGTAFHEATHILRKKLQATDTIASFYQEKKDSLDVLFVGSSHAYYAFSLWRCGRQRG